MASIFWFRPLFGPIFGPPFWGKSRFGQKRGNESQGFWDLIFAKKRVPKSGITFFAKKRDFWRFHSRKIFANTLFDKWYLRHFRSLFGPLFGPTFGPFCHFLWDTPWYGGLKLREGPEVVQKVVKKGSKKWSKNGCLAISGCRHFWDTPWFSGKSWGTPKMNKYGQKPIFWPLFGPTFGPLFVTFLRHPYRGPFEYYKRYPKWSRRWSKSGQKVVKKWVFGHLCHFRGVTFFGVPQKVTYFVGSLFGPTFGPPFVTFLINHRRGPYKYSKRYPKWSKRWSKTGHLRVPKTPILTKNGDFWTKTPRGSPGWWQVFGPPFFHFCGNLFLCILEFSGGQKKWSKNGFFRWVKNRHFWKNWNFTMS